MVLAEGVVGVFADPQKVIKSNDDKVPSCLLLGGHLRGAGKVYCPVWDNDQDGQFSLQHGVLPVVCLYEQFGVFPILRGGAVLVAWVGNDIHFKGCVDGT